MLRPRRMSSPPPSCGRQIRRRDHHASWYDVIIRLVEIGEIIDTQWRGAFRKVPVDASEQVNQAPTLDFGKAGESLTADFVRKIEDASEDRARLIGQDKPASAAVARVGPPFDPALLFHTIDLSNQSHRLDFEQIGEAGLVNALV